MRLVPPLAAAVPARLVVVGDPVSPYVPAPRGSVFVGSPYYPPAGLVYPELTDDPALVTRRLLVMHNDARQSRGLPLLAPSPFLLLAAARHANWMARNSVLGHFGVGDGDVGGRAAAAGYDYYRAVGENVAWNHPDCAAVFAGWMASPGHRANILSTSFRHYGGYVVRGPRGNFWCSVFGGAADLTPTVVVREPPRA
jgi:hypothetical protein